MNGVYLWKLVMDSTKILHFKLCNEGGVMLVSWLDHELVTACKRQCPSPGVAIRV